MTAALANSLPDVPSGAPKLTKVAAFQGLRALCWDNGDLYASRGYELLRGKVNRQDFSLAWEPAGVWRAGLARRCTCSVRLASRFCRDGFHALAVLSSGHTIGAVPGRIITRAPGESEFRTSHKLLRGTRPLHITAGPSDHLVWGEYIDNTERTEVHIYGSTDHGEHWDVAYTFPKGAIRHVHNVVYDSWDNCYWVLTGDVGSECRMLRASLDFRSMHPVLAGSQQTRSAVLIPTREAIYFSSDTPLESNHVYRLARTGNLAKVAVLSSSSIYGCRVGNCVFFSTMVEPSEANRERDVCLFGSSDGLNWQRLLQWPKDLWPLKLFQYGNAFLPDGDNNSGLLALTTIAVKGADLETTIWRVGL
jgi:hypothetical protein